MTLEKIRSEINMKISNIHNLPDSIKQAVEVSNRPLLPDLISVTTLIDSPYIRYLRMKHWEELTEDASDRIWALLGSAVHYIIDKSETPAALTEERLTITHSSGIRISGMPDHYENEEITDYKVTSVYSFLKGLKPEWEKQLNLYAFLFRAHGFPVKSLKIQAILRDWQRGKVLADPDYPIIPFMTVNVPLWSPERVQEYIDVQIAEHTADPVRFCIPAERWQKEPQFAVMKGDNKRATRVFDTEIEANMFRQGHKDANKMLVVSRPGGYMRCQDYCNVAMYCQTLKDEADSFAEI